MKKCAKCKIVKDMKDFYNDSRTKDGLNYLCIKCVKEEHKKWRKNNKKEINERNKEYYKNNKETINKKQKIIYQKNKEKIKERVIIKNYGITMEEYNLKREKQNFKCAICGVNEEEICKSLSIDHCHISGMVRGLLCSNCNFIIGNACDNIGILKKAIEYLNYYNR